MTYQRGDRVVVTGHGGRRATLVVWEDRGRGLCLSSDDGYRRLLAGEREAPLVGFPRRDIVGPASVNDPTSEPLRPS